MHAFILNIKTRLLSGSVYILMLVYTLAFIFLLDYFHPNLITRFNRDYSVINENDPLSFSNSNFLNDFLCEKLFEEKRDNLLENTTWKERLEYTHKDANGTEIKTCATVSISEFFFNLSINFQTLKVFGYVDYFFDNFYHDEREEYNYTLKDTFLEGLYLWGLLSARFDIKESMKIKNVLFASNTLTVGEKDEDNIAKNHEMDSIMNDPLPIKFSTPNIKDRYSLKDYTYENEEEKNQEEKVKEVIIKYSGNEDAGDCLWVYIPFLQCKNHVIKSRLESYKNLSKIIEGKKITNISEGVDTDEASVELVGEDDDEVKEIKRKLKENKPFLRIYYEIKLVEYSLISRIVDGNDTIKKPYIETEIEEPKLKEDAATETNETKEEEENPEVNPKKCSESSNESEGNKSCSESEEGDNFGDFLQIIGGPIGFRSLLPSFDTPSSLQKFGGVISIDTKCECGGDENTENSAIENVTANENFTANENVTKNSTNENVTENSTNETIGLPSYQNFSIIFTGADIIEEIEVDRENGTIKKRVFFKQDRLKLPTHLLSLTVGNFLKKKIGKMSEVYYYKEIEVDFEDVNIERIVEEVSEFFGEEYFWEKLNFVLFREKIYNNKFYRNDKFYPNFVFLKNENITKSTLKRIIITHVINSFFMLNPPQSWKHIWINKGMITWIERNFVLRKFFSEEKVGEIIKIGKNNYDSCMKYFELIGKSQYLNLIQPDILYRNDEINFIPQEKGYLLLNFLCDIIIVGDESTSKKEEFRKFILYYLKEYRYNPITTHDFVEIYESFFEGRIKRDELNWEALINH